MRILLSAPMALGVFVTVLQAQQPIPRSVLEQGEDRGRPCKGSRSAGHYGGSERHDLSRRRDPETPRGAEQRQRPQRRGRQSGSG